MCDFVRLLLCIIKISINVDEIFGRIYLVQKIILIVFLSSLWSDIEM
jgi:hypothetical protein